MNYFWFKKLKKIEFQQNLTEFFFSLSKPKVVIFSTIFQIFMFYGRKQVETEQSFYMNLLVISNITL